MLVRDLMTPDPLVLLAEDDAILAEQFMEFAHIRHLPVVDGGQLIGLVTHRDLLSAVIGNSGEQPQGQRPPIQITEIMRKGIKTVSPGTDVRYAIELMMEHKYGCLPVENDGQLVGILTEADFLKFTLSLLGNNKP